MADEYKGLYVKFRGDATELTKALRQIRSETRQADRQLSDINKALKFDSKSVELLAERMKSAEKAAQSQAREVDTLKEAQKELGERTDENAEAYDRLSREVAIAEAKLKEAQKQVVKATEAHTELGQKSAAWAELSTKAENAAKKISNVSDAIGKAGKSLTKGVTVPIMAVATASAAAAIEIDTAWYDVRKTVDATEEEYRQLKDAAIELSQTNPISASTILETEALGAQLGVAKENLEEFAMTVSELDVATNLSSEEAATQIAQFANITKQAWQEAYTATEYYEKLASVVVHLGNNTATTESDIMNMSTRFASSATMAGFTTAEIMGVSTALASTGMNAEAAGSALSTSVLLASKAVETAGMSLEEYQDSIHRWDKTSEKSYTTQQQHLQTLAEVSGKTVEQFAADWKENAPEAFVDLIVKMGEVQDESGDLATKLDAMGLGSIRTSDAMRRLAGNSEHLTGIIEMANEAWDDGTYAQQEYEQRSQSLASQIEVLKNRVIAIAEDVGGPLVNAVLDVIDQCEPLIHVVEDAAQAFNDMSEEEQQATLKNVALVAAIGPLLSIVGKLGNGFSTIVSGVGKLWGAYSKATGAINSFLVAAKASNDQLVGGEINADKTSQKLGLLFNKYTAAAGGADQYYEALKSLRTAKEDQAAIDAKIDQNEQAVAKSMQLRKSAASEAVAAQREMSDASKDAAAASGAEKAAHEKVQAAVDAEKAAKEALRQAESDLDGQKVKVAEAATEKEASLRRQNVANAKVEQAELQAVVNERKRDLNEATAAVKEAKAEEDAASKAVVKAEQRKTDATKKYTTSKKKYLDTTAAVAKNEEDHIELQERLAAAEKETAAATAACNEVQQKSTGIMGRLRTAGNVLKGALTGVVGVAKTLWKTLWPMAVITAGIAIVQKVIDYFQELKEKAETLEAATTDLKDAVKDGIQPTSELGDAASDTADDVQTLCDKIYDNIEAQSQLASSIEETYDKTGLQVSELEQAVDIIDQYANKTGLSAVEQGKFRAAIDTVNRYCDTQYKVIDASRGIFADEAGAIQKSTDALRLNANQRIANMKAEAELAVGQGLYETMVKNQATLADSEEKLAEKQAELNRLQEEFNRLADGDRSEEDIARMEEINGRMTELRSEIDQLTPAVEANREAAEASADAYETWAGRYASASAAAALGIESLSSFVKTNDTLAKALDGSAHSAELFALKCQDAGLSTDSLATLSEDNLKKLVADFDGTTDSVIQSLVSMGEEGRAVLDGTASDWANSLSDGDREIVSAAKGTLDMTYLEFRAFAAQLGIEGDQAIVAYADALNNPDLPEGYAKQIGKAVSSALQIEGELKGYAAQSIQAYALALADNGPEATDEAQKVADAVQRKLNGEDLSQDDLDLIEPYLSQLDQMKSRAEAKAKETAESVGAEYGTHMMQTAAGEVEASSQLLTDAVDSTFQGAADQVRVSSSLVAIALDDAAASATSDSTPTWEDLGVRLGTAADEGVGKGISDSTSYISDGVTVMYDATEGYLRAAFGWHSPAQLGADLGEGIDDGVGTGIAQNTDLATAPIDTLESAIVARFEEMASSIGPSVGSAVGDGLASGMAGAAVAVQSAAASLGTSAQSGLSKAPTQAKASGKATGANYALGITGTATNSKTGGTLLGTNVVSGMDTAKTKAKSSGQTSGSQFAYGVSSKSSVVSAAGRVLANSTSTLNSRAGSATTWGQHLGGNFAAGISSKYGAVVAAANSLASAASSVLKFSVPKEGPWSGAERGGYTSGRHLVENIASGMYAAIPEMERAARAVGQAMEPPAYAQQWAQEQMSDLAGSYSKLARTNRSTGNPAYADAIASAVAEAVASQEVAVYVDGKRLSGAIAGSMNRQLGTLQHRWNG